MRAHEFHQHPAEPVGHVHDQPVLVAAKIEDHAVVADEVEEGRTIEYKLELPSGKDSERKEFLADESSFANAAGGDLLYGIEEKRDVSGNTTGIPESLPGLAGINADEVIRRLVRAATDIKRVFGQRDQDIEWAYMKGQIYIVQSRPFVPGG